LLALSPKAKQIFWVYQTGANALLIFELFFGRELRYGDPMSQTTLPTIQFINTLKGKKEVFEPLKTGEVSIYLCGPTVYGYTHIGNARAALVGDLVTRVFEYAGYKVNFAKNITDIDDKIITKANEEGRSTNDVTTEFETAYNEEMDALGIRKPNHTPHATEYVEHMTRMIQTLIDKDCAYVADTPFGKDVYLRVSAMKDYGKLSKRKVEDMLDGARIEVGEAKEAAVDSTLWKAAKPGEPSWNFEGVGEGRPGWHIECSAMIDAIFQDGLDIHMGGLDLIFPHHENEIAQSECAHPEKPFAKYWIHNGMLTIQREKMSKSIGNVFRTNAFLEEFGPETLKLICLQHHYRGPIDFSDELNLRTEALVERLYRAKAKYLEHESASCQDSELPGTFGNLAKMDEALYDDFNSAKAIGFALGALRTCFKEDKPELWSAWGKKCLPLFSKVFSILENNPAAACKAIQARRLKRMNVSEETAQKVEAALESREQLRKDKKFEESDAVRKELEAEGFVIMDGPDGSAWTVNSQKT